MGLVRTILVMLAVAMAAPVMAADVTFSGLVTYRERMALPPNSSLTVILVSLPTQTRITSAGAALAGKAGSPIQFSLNVRSNVLASGGQFGLLAEIRSAGHVIFTNSLPVPVDATEPTGNVLEVTFTPPPPHDPPQQVLPPVETPNPLFDMLWTVTSIGGDPVLPGSRVTLSIAADHRAGGNSGCNNYFSEASFDGRGLAFGPIAGTRMVCDPAIMTQEARFLAALAATAGYELAGDALQLVDAAGVALAGLVRAR